MNNTSSDSDDQFPRKLKRPRSMNDARPLKHRRITSKEHQRDLSWRAFSYPDEIEALEPLYYSIETTVSRMPTYLDVLRSPAPYPDKCVIFEKISVLNNMCTNTLDFLRLRKSIMCDLNNHLMPAQVPAPDPLDAVESLLESISSTIPIRTRVLTSKHTKSNKLVIYNKYSHYTKLCPRSSERPKLLQWIETALNIPTQVTPLATELSVRAFLTHVQRELDVSVYGMATAKEQVLFAINRTVSNPNAKGLSIALVGPQGVGKTELAHAIARAVGLPIVLIPMGGAKDASGLTGHSFTYEGSKPGSIVDALVDAKQLNTIFFLDELDKISKTERGNEISNTLLHITDSTQNHNFKDKYMGSGISINLSNTWFICSLNYVDEVDRTLRDRIPMIEVDGYTVAEKTSIAREHLIPRELKNAGIAPGNIKFSKKALDEIIQVTDATYTSETKSTNNLSGVRQLKHAIADLITKVHLYSVLNEKNQKPSLSYHIDDFNMPFTIKKKHLVALNNIQKNDSVAFDNMSMYM
jgi:ATP-dependent Lon protease